MQLPHLGYRRDIDGLRGIAVLLVVGFHAFPTTVSGGFAGVDIFFVISGYLISTIIVAELGRGSFSFVEFYFRRIRRIFPALLVVLTSCMMFGYSWLLPHDYKELGKHVAAGAAFVSNFVLLAESGYFDLSAHFKPLLHLWSLGIEEQFYLIWPVSLWLCFHQRWNILVLAVAVGMTSFVLNVGLVGAHPASDFYLPWTRLWELMAGAALAISNLKQKAPRPAIAVAPSDLPLTCDEPARPKNRFRPMPNVMSFAGGICLVMGTVLLNRDRAFPGLWAVIPVAGAGFIISAGIDAWLNRVVFSNRVLVWFGLISYPLYLWHWPLISLATILSGDFASRNVRFCLVLASVALAWATYSIIEKRIRRPGNGDRKAITLLVLLVLCGGLGYWCYARDGFPHRYPKIVQDLDAFENGYDHQSAWREGSCFLTLDEGSKAFERCDPEQRLEKKPLILIWGDSLAADLYPGYQTVFGDHYTVVQRTASACAPLLADAFNEQLPNCAEINAYVMRLITLRKPQRVVLSARWSVHDWTNIAAVVAKLRAAGVENIDLIGPVPRWKISLPRQLISYAQRAKSDSLPDRMVTGVDFTFRDIEPALIGVADESHVDYFSPASILCNEAGCITKTGQAVSTLTAFDYDHLTASGSIFLVSGLYKK
jgi:peptidoglycan/LPS O-acetylase OafA/YrhL